MPVPARRPLRRAVLLVAAVSAAMLLTGCGASGPHGGAALRHAVSVGNTENYAVPDTAAVTPLVDQHDHHFTLGSLRGHIVVLAPLLTLCQETCPMTSANMHSAAQAEIGSGRRTHAVFLELSVDPERDTVPRLRAYAALYGQLPNWRLATGKPAQIRALWKAIGVITAKTRDTDSVRDWLTGTKLEHPYDVQHQDLVIAIGGDGRIRWIALGRPDARRIALPPVMRKFLDGEGRQNYHDPTAGGASTWTARDIEQEVTHLQRTQ